MKRLRLGRWTRVIGVSAGTWIGCAGFVRTVGFADWIAVTTAAILALAMFALTAIVWRG